MTKTPNPRAVVASVTHDKSITTNPSNQNQSHATAVGDDRPGPDSSTPSLNREDPSERCVLQLDSQPHLFSESRVFSRKTPEERR